MTRRRPITRTRASLDSSSPPRCSTTLGSTAGAVHTTRGDEAGKGLSDPRSIPSSHQASCPPSRSRRVAGFSPSCRVTGGSCPPPALTEPDLWASHPALRDAGVGGSIRLARRQPCGPQLFQRQLQLCRSDDDLQSAILARQGEEPPFREVRLVEHVVDRTGVAQRPEGLATPIDDSPRRVRSRAHSDETPHDETPAPPLPKQYCAQAPPDMRVEELE